VPGSGPDFCKRSSASKRMADKGMAAVMAGFADVQVIEEYEKGWICGIGKKSSPLADTEASGKS
jgi:hypothetical protein